MRKYELVCIFDPQAGENQFDGLVERYEANLKTHGGEIANIDRWGIRQLAYSSASMRKRRQGYYVLYQFEAEPDAIALIEEELALDESVLRHLVIQVEGEFMRVPELVPENQIIFGPPPRDRDRGRGRDRDRDRGRGRDRDRDGGPPDRERGPSAPAAGGDAPAPAEGEAKEEAAAAPAGDAEATTEEG